MTIALGLVACGLVSACRGPLSEAQISQHLPGTWMRVSNAKPTSYMSVTFSSDGTLIRTGTNGLTESLGTWWIDSKLLVIRTAETHYITSRSSGEKLPLPLETRYHIIRAGEHDLILSQVPPLTLYGADDQRYISLTAAAAEIRFRRSCRTLEN